MPDYGVPEPRQQPIIAPDEDADKRGKQGLPVPARPNWLCITDPKNQAIVPATMSLEMRLSKAERAALKKKERDRARARYRAQREREKAKTAAKRKAEKEKIRNKKEKARAGAKKTAAQIAEMRRARAAHMREVMAKKIAEREKISSERIEAFLHAAKLTHGQLGALLGVTRESVDNYCLGHGMHPSVLAKFKELEENLRRENESRG